MTDSPIAQRVKQKLRDISKETGETFNFIFNKMVLERFIVRVQNSKHKDRLIFKGGLCLGNIINIGRQTKDIDFLIKKVKGEKSEIYNIFLEISEIVIDDGFIFNKVEIIELAIENKKYPGYRININYSFGNAQGKIQIDTGIGDVVLPVFMKLEMIKDKKGSIFGDSIQILAYPPEFIFSEKFQAAILLGSGNSRVKDFHDMYMLIQERVLDLIQLKSAIQLTFKNRETEVKPIIEFEEDSLINLQKYWNAHYNKISKQSKEILPKDFNLVVKAINKFLVENNII